MEKNEIEQLKQQLKQEILSEIRKELNDKSQYDFDKYKKDVIMDDIKKIRQFLNKKFRLSWLIPFIGLYIWSYHVQQAFSSIDRGALRVEINRQTVRQIFWITILGSIAPIINLLFIPQNIALKKAVINMEKKLNNNLVEQ